jgi:hypothetical protein
MTRTNAIRAIQDRLKAAYSGRIQILAEEDDETLRPPYAVVRIGSAEDLGAGQAVIWEFNVLLAVFNDADATTIETAETQAQELFAILADPDDLVAPMTERGVLMSAWQPLSTEAGRDESKWMHVAGWRLVAAPAPASGT